MLLQEGSEGTSLHFNTASEVAQKIPAGLMARDAELQRLKEKRSAAKRKTTRSYNLILSALENGGNLENTRVLREKLEMEFNEFNQAFAAYEKALEEEGQEEIDDYKTGGVYYRQVSSYLFLIENKLNDIKNNQANAEDLADAKRTVKNEFRRYQWQLSEVKTISEAYEDVNVEALREDGSVRVALSVLEQEVKIFKKTLLRTFG